MKDDFQITVIFDPEIIIETKSKTGRIIYSKNPDEKKKNKLIEKLEKKACAFYGALKKTADLFKGGEKSSEKLTYFVIKELVNAGFAIDYAKITDEGLAGGKPDAECGDILLSAVRFKGVRLLDNIYFI